MTNSHSGQSRASTENGTPSQIAQEQRRIADRQQAAAAVADDEDEEHHGVSDVLAFAVGFQQRADQQHRRARRADEAGQHAADGHERGVGERAGLEIAFDANAAGDRVQTEQQHDERHELGQDRIGEHGVDEAGLHAASVGDDDAWAGQWESIGALMQEGVVAERDQAQPGGDLEAVEIALPPMLGGMHQRKDGNRPQQQRRRE